MKFDFIRAADFLGGQKENRVAFMFSRHAISRNRNTMSRKKPENVIKFCLIKQNRHAEATEKLGTLKVKRQFI